MYKIPRNEFYIFDLSSTSPCPKSYRKSSASNQRTYELSGVVAVVHHVEPRGHPLHQTRLGHKAKTPRNIQGRPKQGTSMPIPAGAFSVIPKPPAPGGAAERMRSRKWASVVSKCCRNDHAITPLLHVVASAYRTSFNNTGILPHKRFTRKEIGGGGNGNCMNNGFPVAENNDIVRILSLASLDWAWAAHMAHKGTTRGTRSQPQGPQRLSVSWIRGTSFHYAIPTSPLSCHVMTFVDLTRY